MARPRKVPVASDEGGQVAGDELVGGAGPAEWRGKRGVARKLGKAELVLSVAESARALNVR